VLTETGTVANDVIAEAKAAHFLREQPLQALLALDQRQLRRALAIEVKEIESEKDKFIRPAFVHRGLEAAEHRHAVRSKRAELTIYIGRLCRQRAERFNGAAIPMRPVEARPGEQFDLLPVNACMHAVAVIFDLVQPFFAARRFVGEARELRPDPNR
jgi:hypothetical protein